MPGSTQPGGTQKYEREIAEILERMERAEPKAERVKRKASSTLGQRWQAWRRAARIGPLNRYGGHTAGWTWMGLTVAAGVAGLALYALSPLLGALCGIVMVGLFFSPFFRQVSAPPPRSASNVWRGQIVDLPPRSGLLATLGYYWRRFRHRRRL